MGNRIDPGPRDEHSDNQEGALFVSSQTGGFMIFESNRIDDAWHTSWGTNAILRAGLFNLRRRHSNGSHRPAAYQNWKIEVTRPGVKVRSSAGFFASRMKSGARRRVSNCS